MAHTWKDWKWTLIALIPVLILIIPIYFVLISGFETVEEIYHQPPYLIPPNPTSQYYTEAWTTLNHYLMNSLVISVGVLALTLVVAAPAACFGQTRLARREDGIISDGVGANVAGEHSRHSPILDFLSTQTYQYSFRSNSRYFGVHHSFQCDFANRLYALHALGANSSSSNRRCVPFHHFPASGDAHLQTSYFYRWDACISERMGRLHFRNILFTGATSAAHERGTI